MVDSIHGCYFMVYKPAYSSLVGPILQIPQMERDGWTRIRQRADIVIRILWNKTLACVYIYTYLYIYMRNSKVRYIFYEPQVVSSPPKTVVGPFRTCIVLLFLCKTHGICSKLTGYVVCCTLGTGFFGYVWRLLGVNLQFSDTPKYHMVGNICHNLRYITGNQNLPLSYWCSYHIPCYPHMFVLIFFRGCTGSQQVSHPLTAEGNDPGTMIGKEIPGPPVSTKCENVAQRPPTYKWVYKPIHTIVIRCYKMLQDVIRCYKML